MLQTYVLKIQYLLNSTIVKNSTLSEGSTLGKVPCRVSSSWAGLLSFFAVQWVAIHIILCQCVYVCHAHSFIFALQRMKVTPATFCLMLLTCTLLVEARIRRVVSEVGRTSQDTARVIELGLVVGLEQRLAGADPGI